MGKLIHSLPSRPPHIRLSTLEDQLEEVARAIERGGMRNTNYSVIGSVSPKNVGHGTRIPLACHTRARAKVYQ